MTFSFLLAVIFCVSVFLAFMALAILVPLSPGVLSLLEPLVCRKGEMLCLTVTKATYHRPGERGLLAECVGPSGRRSVRPRIMLLAFLAVFVVAFLRGLVVTYFVKS